MDQETVYYEELKKIVDRRAKAIRKERLLRTWLLPLRIILFPVALTIKLFKWTYGYEN